MKSMQKIFTHHAAKKGIGQSFAILEKLPACLVKGLSLLLQSCQCHLDCRADHSSNSLTQVWAGKKIEEMKGRCRVNRAGRDKSWEATNNIRVQFWPQKNEPEIHMTQ